MTRLTLITCALFVGASTATAATPEPVAAENAPSILAATETAPGPENPPAASRGKIRGDALTLDAITIEGEVDVPQVLFITARDHLRATTSEHELYWRDAVSTVLALPTIGPVRPPVDASTTHQPAPHREK